MPQLRTTALAMAVSAAALTGCAPGQAEDDGLINVVASTSVWGDIAATIGGDRVSVTNLIDGPDRDPHSFEASALDRLALVRADIVIVNGGGYDPFVGTLLGAELSVFVLDASEASGLLDGENEHIWYDFIAVDEVAVALAEQLAALDPAHEQQFRANYEAFAAELDSLEADAAAIAAEFTGQGAAVTEAVPVYLLEAAGLVNETPGDFTQAIEEGGDVPPAALQRTLDLFDDGAVVVLGYNEQTASPETERVRAAAEAAGIPDDACTETLPTGSDYESWMRANLDSLARALR